MFRKMRIKDGVSQWYCEGCEDWFDEPEGD